MPAPKKYPDELRERGVRLVFESGRPIAQVARISASIARRCASWVRQAEADDGQRADLLTSGEREQHEGAASARCSELRRANEILKAASVFFAKELDPPRPK